MQPEAMAVLADAGVTRDDREGILRDLPRNTVVWITSTAVITRNLSQLVFEARSPDCVGTYVSPVQVARLSFLQLQPMLGLVGLAPTA